MEQSHFYTWSDNWWIEDQEAWFILGEYDLLFKLDMQSGKCAFVTNLPNESKIKFRLNPNIIKCENYIVCMPDLGDAVWIYNIDTLEFQKIIINNPENERIGIANFWKIGEKIFAVSTGLKQVLEIDLRGNINYYDIAQNVEERISLSIIVDRFIYSVSSISNKIYGFDMVTKEVVTYIIPNVKGGLRSISYDGEKFWLTGYRKEIYIWDKMHNEVKIIDDFPNTFGLYNFEGVGKGLIDYGMNQFDRPLFMNSLVVGDNIWFIPFQTNQVLYVNKNTYKINIFEMENEEETINSLRREMGTKYLVQCVNEGEIVLYSLKNDYIIFIDAENMKMHVPKYKGDDEDLEKIVEVANGMLFERKKIDREIYRKRLFDNKSMKNNSKNIGSSIHKKIIDEMI